MERYHDVVTQLASSFLQRIKLYSMVILVFCYHFIFEKDLPCTCSHRLRDCNLYMILPFSIIFVAQLWMDKACQRGLRGCKRGCSCFMISRLFTALFLSCIWPISVLIDGDWSVCCWNQSSHNISCKNESKLTDEERDILREIKDDSRVLGLGLLLILLVFAFVISCVNKQPAWSSRGNWMEIVLEEEENVVSDELRRKAKEQLEEKVKAYMDNRELEKCFTVGDEVITGMETPPPETAIKVCSEAVCVLLLDCLCPPLKQSESSSHD